MTREQPLFSPARRPPAPAVVAAPSVPPAQRPPKPAEPDRPLLTLIGTIVGKTQSIGIFVDQVAKNVIRLRIGQDHAGWTLRAIQVRQAIFEKGAREATLVLPARSAADQVAASVSTPPSAAERLGDTWVDGDGRHISPPKAPWASGAGNPQARAPATSQHGDGQRISPPPAHAAASAH